MMCCGGGLYNRNKSRRIIIKCRRRDFNLWIRRRREFIIKIALTNREYISNYYKQQ